MYSQDFCCTAMILDFPAAACCLIVSASCLVLIMLPVSVGSRPATGHADVVVDNWSTVEDYECVVILSRWRPALGDCTLHLRKEGSREGPDSWMSYHAVLSGSVHSHSELVSRKDLTRRRFIKRTCMMLSSALFLIQLVSNFSFEHLSNALFYVY